MRRTLAVFLILTLLVIGGGLIATMAYQAGVATAVSTAVVGANGAVVAPVIVPSIGYGWAGPGFGILWFFGFLFVLFLVFGLIRALTFRGRAWGGPGGPGGPWEARARRTFDDWHRAAHEPSSTADADAHPPTAGGPTVG